MKILIYQWKAYNYRDVYETLRLFGHEVYVFEESLEQYDKDLIFEKKLEKRLREESFDFVFTMNYFAAIANVCHRCQVDYLVWTCDNPLISMFHKSIFYEENYIFTFDKTNYYEWKQMGLKHIFYLPLAVDTDRVNRICETETSEEVVKFSNEIAFVGSLYEKNSYDEFAMKMPDYLKGYLDAVVVAQSSISGGNIIEEMLTADILEQIETVFTLEKSEDSFSDLSLVFSTTVLGFKVAEQVRRRTLTELAKKFSVGVYSNSDCSDLLLVEKRGGVDYWTEMPKVFHNSKINLNMTIPNIKSGIPLRVFDVLAAQGFLITNYQAELPIYFDQKKDLVYYESLEELSWLCEYYLQHEEERLEIAQNGYEKVKKYHNIKVRLGRMLALWKEEK